MKKLGALAAVLVVGAMVAGASLLGMVGAFFGAANAQNPCIFPVGNVAPAGGPVRFPVVGVFQVTSEFGMRYNPGTINTGAYMMHEGIDLAETVSGPIVAPMSGVVESTPTTLTGGNVVIINHGGGLITRYHHLSARTVVAGDEVWAGRQIGIQGSTGNSSGPHLHFQVEVNGQPVNPRDWMTGHGLVVPPTRGTGTAPGALPTPPAGWAAPLQGSIVPALFNPSPQTQPLTESLPTHVGRYTGEQIVNAAHIIKAGQAMSLDARTITIGVMTAMGESSLINIAHGDAVGPDSRGLFQQRDNGAWGTLADRMNPTIASTNFFKALTAVPNYLTLEPTIAAHKTQRNADPYHYAQFWADAVLVVATLTEDPTLLDSLPTAGTVTGCETGGPAPAPAPGDGSGDAIVAAATHYLGTPYAWGGGTLTGPSTGTRTTTGGGQVVGFDCSGLVLYAVHNATSIQLPHSAELQGKDPRGTAVPRDWNLMQPGDIIAFSEDGSGAPGSFGHVGIYLGDGKMIHAPRPGKTVEITQIRGSAYHEAMAWSIRRFANHQ